MRTTAEPLHASPDTVKYILHVAETIEPDDGQLAGWYRAYCATHAERIAFDLMTVEQYARGTDTILDLASAPFLLLAALQNRGKNVIGVDIAPDRFSQSISRLGLKVHQCDIELEPLPVDEQSIDIVVLNETFEHLRINPIFTFHEIRRVLKPGGIILMSTPNGLSLKHWVQLLAKRRIGPDIFSEYEKLSLLGHMGHVREYSCNEVADFLCQMGFSLDQVRFRGRYAGRESRAYLRPVRMLSNGLCSLFSPLRPFFSVVAHK